MTVLLTPTKTGSCWPFEWCVVSDTDDENSDHIQCVHMNILVRIDSDFILDIRWFLLLIRKSLHIGMHICNLAAYRELVLGGS